MLTGAHLVELRATQVSSPEWSDVQNVHGGGDRHRTCDVLLARQVLSQLSYSPSGGPCGIRTRDLSADNGACNQTAPTSRTISRIGIIIVVHGVLPCWACWSSWSRRRESNAGLRVTNPRHGHCATPAGPARPVVGSASSPPLAARMMLLDARNSSTHAVDDCERPHGGRVSGRRGRGCRGAVHGGDSRAPPVKDERTGGAWHSRDGLSRPWRTGRGSNPRPCG